MVFAYYNRLTSRQQEIYRRSDAIAVIRLPRPGQFQPLIHEIDAALQSESRSNTQSACNKLVVTLTTCLEIPAVNVKVLTSRPHANWGELHGLYQPASEADQVPAITVWMRTAKRKRVVKFRTFLRTVLHELCHHMDYALLKLPDSLHTEGFYKRESSLFHQLVPKS